MRKITQNITINRPAQYAFDFTLNPENTPKWVDTIIAEQASEEPTKLGTVYKNHWQDGSWKEFKITSFRANGMFEMTEKGSNVHVTYIFTPLSEKRCRLEYIVKLDAGELAGPFNQTNIRQILQKLKTVIEE